MKLLKKRALARFMRGFSLIEIMVVITLVAIFVGIGTVYFMGQLQQGRETAARQQAYEIAKAVDLYKVQTGNYPTTAEGLAVLTNPARGNPTMERIPLDPWGREYNYVIPGAHNPNGFDVWSDGPDGQGGDAAIGNWLPE